MGVVLKGGSVGGSVWGGSGVGGWCRGVVYGG